MRTMLTWRCPKCRHAITVRGASEVVHECPRNHNRLTRYVAESPMVVAS